MNADKLLEQSVRADRARDILESEVFNAALATIEADYIALWKNTPVRDAAAREHIWAQLKNLGLLKDHLQIVMTGGNLAKKQLDEMLNRPKPDWSQV